MPKKTGTGNPYGYDPKTDTVQVGRHDLERLLLMFRSLVRKQEPGIWEHMRDYDLSFERLAAAADGAAQARHGARREGRDLRMRCTTTEPVYDLPDGTPYGHAHLAVWLAMVEGGGPPRERLAGLPRMPPRSPARCRAAPRQLVSSSHALPPG